MNNCFNRIKGILPDYLKNMKVVAVPLAVVTVTILAGCAQYLKPGFVYKEWTRTMSQEGIFPVFPPREDVQVGDVWLLPLHPLETGVIEDIGGLGLTGVWHANVLNGTGTDTVSEFYRNRPLFPSTIGTATTASIVNPLNKGTDTANTPEMKILPVPSSNNDIFTSGSVYQLRQVAFPEFSYTKIDKQALNALVPIEYFNVAGGLAHSRVRQISLKIPSAESYGIPSGLLLRPFFPGMAASRGTDTVWFATKDVKSDEGVHGFWLKSNAINGINKLQLALARSQFNEAFNKLDKSKEINFSDDVKKELKTCQNYVWIAVITEVFYARAMDINIGTTKGTGFGLNIQPITNAMLGELDRLKNIGKKAKKTTKTAMLSPTPSSIATQGATTSEPTPAASPEPTPTSSSSEMKDTAGRTIVETVAVEETDDAFTLAKKMNDYNKNLGAQAVPGGSVNVVSTSDTSVGLRRIYDRPIAVGVRGVIMRVNINKSNDDTLFVDFVSIGENK